MLKLSENIRIHKPIMIVDQNIDKIQLQKELIDLGFLWNGGQESINYFGYIFTLENNRLIYDSLDPLTLQMRSSEYDKFKLFSKKDAFLDLRYRIHI